MKRRIEDLERRIFRYAPPPTPEKAMSDIIFEEWCRDLDKYPDHGDRETVGRVWDDLIQRLKECPVTAGYGALVERYREVIVDETLRRHNAPEQSERSDSPEYREA
jgi:hypothetical protein